MSGKTARNPPFSLQKRSFLEKKRPFSRIFSTSRLAQSQIATRPPPPRRKGAPFGEGDG
jgi:hypothetical protein